MAIATDILLSYDLGLVETIQVCDASTFTGGSSISDINGVRMLFSTVNSRAGIQTNVSTLTAWTEYIVVSGSVAINGITYSANDLILLANDTSIGTGNFQVDETGRYGQYISSQLPINGLPYVFNPSQVNRPYLDNLYFIDEAYTLDYYQYGTIYSAGDTLASGTYLCVGTQDDSVTIGGRTIYVGETYESAGSETFSGTPNLVLYIQDESFDFSTQGQSFLVLQSYLDAFSRAVNPALALQSNLLEVMALYSTFDVATQINYNYSVDQIQDNIDRILNYYQVNV